MQRPRISQVNHLPWYFLQDFRYDHQESKPQHVHPSTWLHFHSSTPHLLLQQANLASTPIPSPKYKTKHTNVDDVPFPVHKLSSLQHVGHTPSSTHQL